jgi:hypothetical protein
MSDAGEFADDELPGKKGLASYETRTEIALGATITFTHDVWNSLANGFAGSDILLQVVPLSDDRIRT